MYKAMLTSSRWLSALLFAGAVSALALAPLPAFADSNLSISPTHAETGVSTVYTGTVHYTGTAIHRLDIQGENGLTVTGCSGTLPTASWDGVWCVAIFGTALTSGDYTFTITATIDTGASAPDLVYYLNATSVPVTGTVGITVDAPPPPPPAGAAPVVEALSSGFNPASAFSVLATLAPLVALGLIVGFGYFLLRWVIKGVSKSNGDGSDPWDGRKMTKEEQDWQDRGNKTLRGE